MKRIKSTSTILQFFILVFMIPAFFSCGNATASAEKARADSLQVELLKQKIIDSLKNATPTEVVTVKKKKIVAQEPLVDSAAPMIDENVQPDIIGTWLVTMVNEKSTCSDIAENDTRTETWTINLKGGKYVVTISNQSNNGNKKYTGTLQGTSLQLSDEHIGLLSGSTTITVTAEVTPPGDYFSGEREVLRSDPCRLVYSIKGRKL
jgi:hypothetical protein